MTSGGARAAFAALLLLVGLAAARAQPAPPALDLTMPPAAAMAPADCGSVVRVRCADTMPAAHDPTWRRLQQARENADAPRLMPSGPNVVIIEGTIRREPTLAEQLAPAFGPAPGLPRTVTRDMGDGQRCTCIEGCPPTMLSCCQCTPPPRPRGLTTPFNNPLPN